MKLTLPPHSRSMELNDQGSAPPAPAPKVLAPLKAPPTLSPLLNGHSSIEDPPYDSLEGSPLIRGAPERDSSTSRDLLLAPDVWASPSSASSGSSSTDQIFTFSRPPVILIISWYYLVVRYHGDWRSPHNQISLRDPNQVIIITYWLLWFQRAGNLESPTYLSRVALVTDYRWLVVMVAMASGYLLPWLPVTWMRRVKSCFRVCVTGSWFPWSC